jgi:glucose-1-phosphate adenylyltransferase
VNSWSMIEDSVVLPNVVVGRHCTIRRAVIDKLCTIPEGFSVGVNADEDRRRFFVTEKGVTLITPEMLGQEPHLFR